MWQVTVISVFFYKRPVYKQLGLGLNNFQGSSLFY